MVPFTTDNVFSPPPSFNFATDVVDGWARKDPSLLALQWIDDDVSKPLSFTYEHFSRQSCKAARLLLALGAKPGDRVMIILNRVPAWWEIATAVLRAGLVLCPCTTLATTKDIEYRLQTSGASILIGNEESLRKVANLRSSCPDLRVVLQASGDSIPGVPQYSTEVERHSSEHLVGVRTRADDPALIYFTSGTTGLPKMVVHTHVSYPLAHLLTGIHWLNLSAGKLAWTLAEQGWAKAAWSWFSTWNTGATLFVQDSNKPFSPTSTLDVLHKFPITTFCAPPTAYRQLVTAQSQAHFATHRPRALQTCVGAGEPLNPGVIEAWKEMAGIEIRDGYGQTETILVAGNCAGVQTRVGSMGKAIPGIPLHVIDEDGGIADAGVEGDLAVLAVDENGAQSAFIYKGYVSSKGELSRKSRPRRDANGAVSGEWHLSGDRAYQDGDGYFWFVGRSDDVINSSGYRIGKGVSPSHALQDSTQYVAYSQLPWLTFVDATGPFEVESTLKLHPAVVESAVVGVPDAARGEIVKAYVVLDPSFASRDHASLARELQEHCKREAAPYKYPRSIQFVAPHWLPKTTSGKIRRGEIRKWEKAAAASSSKI
ncbi:hypothetical protein PV08_11955 [Exophiala spinifera]|uniref:medium-chain acyl-CoA ligase n=1 Tax=Exophiala spinifera TaxID=91928 RepID=A0A0D2BEP3_9EURO|nr:uncharacterized protein PV08_11955 [Exophiala spinifera]KIW09854.1 hypothetical protein PV08_11955 [Exophiala spinifera]